MQDFQYALRLWRRTPALSAIIVLSLAIGIGANTAVFSVADALFLRPLPFPEPDRIAHLWLRSPGTGIQQDWPSPGQYIDIKSQNHVFEELAISRSDTFILTGRGRAERVEGFFTSSGLFHLLGARTILGQTFGARQDIPGDQYKAVITYGFWKRAFGGDPQVIGQTAILDGHPLTVVGVLGPDFSLDHEAMPPATTIDGAEIFVPLPLGPNAVNNRFDENYNVTARLRRGVSIEQAQAEVSAIAEGIRVRDRRDRTFTIVAIPMLEQIVGHVRRVVFVLLGAVGFVLLIACANVANLLLSRATAREREMAVRAASGATRGRLIRQLLAESMLLSVAGGATGLLLAYAGIAIMRSVAPANIPRIAEISLNGTVLAFTAAISILTGMLFGAVPAVRISNANLNTCLNAGGRGMRSSRGSDHFRNALVVTELAVSLVLLIGAGLLLRSFHELQNVPPGFRPDHILTTRVSLRGTNYPRRDNILHFFDAVHDRLSRLPSVASEAATSAPPFSGTLSWGPLEVEGYTPPPDQPELQADFRSISPDYFKVMQVPLFQGRAFVAQDVATSPRVVIVDQTLAKRFWPGGDIIGKRVRFRNRDNVWLNVVGVAGVVRHGAAGHAGADSEPRLAVYLPCTQTTLMDMYIVARTAADPLALALAVTREIHLVDPDVPVYGITTVEQDISRSLARERFAVATLGTFAILALMLAGVGVYGVMSFLVTRSTHDIGIRMALGAMPRDIFSMILIRGAWLFGGGLAAGLAGAFALSRLLASMLFGVSVTDGAVFAAVPVFLGLTALVACCVPARRASSVDPMKALREE